MQFIVEDTKFTLSYDNYKRSNLLMELVELGQSPITIEHTNAEDFTILFDYLTLGVVPDINKVCVLEYFGVKFTDSYELASLFERNLRQCMYTSNEECYKQPYYGLIQLTQEIWDDISFDRNVTPEMLFTGIAKRRVQVSEFEYETELIDKVSWNQVQEGLSKLAPFLNVDGIMVAGGALYSVLFGLEFSDIDLFLCGIKEDEAEAKVQELIYSLIENDYLKSYHSEEYDSDDDESTVDQKDCLSDIKVVRSANALTICCSPDIQIVLRLYQTPSEVLHGFDIGSCSLGLTKNGLWMTHRCWYALEHGYNKVDFDRLSPSYPYRLAKYGGRGMRVLVPGFIQGNVNQTLIDKDFLQHLPGDSVKSNAPPARFGHLKKKQGLDLLLFLDKHCDYFGYNPWSMSSLQRLASESSDYSVLPYATRKEGYGASAIAGILVHLLASRKDNPESAEQYMPLFAKSNLEWLDPEQYESAITEQKLTRRYWWDPENPAMFIPFQAKREYKDRVLWTYYHYSLPNVDNRHFYYPEDEIVKNHIFCTFLTNSIPRARKIEFFVCNLIYLPVMLHMPIDLYSALTCVRPCTFKPDLEWKVQNPGEQMTNTFNKIVLTDNSEWYKGKYYNY